jgi:hypothetical protein
VERLRTEYGRSSRLYSAADFIPCAAAPLRAVCSSEVHAVALRVVGLVPFTAQPAHDILDEERRAKQTKEDLVTRSSYVAAASDSLVNFLPSFFGVGEADAPVANPQIAAAAAAASLNADEEADRKMASSGLKMTDEEVGHFAAREAIKFYKNTNGDRLLLQERTKLNKIGRDLKWATQTSGGVMKRFQCHASSDVHRAYQAAIKAKNVAVTKNKEKRKKTKEVNAAAKLEQMKARCVAALVKGQQLKWVQVEIMKRTNFSVPDLIALAVVDGGLTIKKETKKEVLLVMANYLDLKRATIPRQQRGAATANPHCPTN